MRCKTCLLLFPSSGIIPIEMRIAILVPFYLPVIGGMEYHAYEMGTELQKRGHEVDILTAGIDHSGKRILPAVEVKDGLTIRRYNVWLRLGKFASLWPGFIFDLNRYDIVHVQNMRQPHTDLAMIFGKLMGKKVVFSTQSPLHQGTHSRIQEFFIKIYDNFILRVLSLGYDAIFAHHQLEKDYLVAHGVQESKIRVVHLGVGDATFRKQALGYFKKLRKAHPRIMLFVGRLSNMKGLDVLLEAFAKAKGREKWALVLVGPDGGELGKLQRLKKKLSLNNVYFWGSVTEEEVERATADADLFLLPSVYEPYGLVLIKAMAKGVPCISINDGGPTEIIKNGETGLLSGFGAEPLMKTMEKLMNNEKLRKGMGKKAEKRARQFTLKGMVDSYERVYQELME